MGADAIATKPPPSAPGQGAGRVPSGGSGSGGGGRGPRSRGVTHHPRTGRHESHIWDDGRQIYLGGYYVEDQAALAYDLAAVRFRGEDATTNAPAGRYAAELGEQNRYTREQIVTHLRDQSKAMNKVVPAAGGAPGGMAPWEVALAAALAPEKVHLGVFAGEKEAACQYDRCLVMALGGVAAAPLLNFPLTNYLDCLCEFIILIPFSLNAITNPSTRLINPVRTPLAAPQEVAEAVHRGVLPAEVATSFEAAPFPRPLYYAVPCLLPTTLPLAHWGSPSADGEATPSDPSAAGTRPVSRRKGDTPRSVLEDGGGDPAFGAPQAEDRPLSADQPGAKRHRSA